MDAIAPVGAQIQPPAPVNALGTLSSLYGLQSQQLGIQQQQQALQGQAANVQQEQQKNSELKALSTFSQNAAQDPKYHNPDGSLNTQLFQQDAMKVAPTYGQQFIGQTTSNANQAVANRQALLNLSNDQRATVGSYFGAVAADPNATTDSFLSAVEQARGVSQDPGYQRAIDSALMHTPQVAGMPTAQASAAVRQFARNVALSTGAPDAAQSAPTTADYTTPGGQIGQRQTNIQSPVGLGAVGPTTAQGLGPAQTPAYQAAISSAATRATGVGGIDVQRANQVSSNVQPSAAAIPLTTDIDDLADQIHSGKFVAKVSQAAAAVGLTTETYARQLLAKDLGQVQAKAEAFAPTDQARQTILSGYPEPTSDPQTIHTAMDYIRGSFRQNVERGQQMLAYQKQHPDLTGFQQADDAYTSKVNPLTAEYRALKPGTTRQGFLQRNFKSADEAQAFASQAGQ